MRCQTCGEELREGARFCPTCGTPTQPGAVPAAPTVQMRRQPDPNQTVVGGVQPPTVDTTPTPPSAPPPQAEPSIGAARDPGAGYDPLGPSRPAPQAAQAAGAGAVPAAAPRLTEPAPAPRRATGATLAGGIVAPTSSDWSTLVARLQRLARLDTSVFGEIYADARSTIPVAVFSAIVLVISGIGGMLFISSLIGFDVYGSDFSPGHGTAEFFLLSVLLGTVFALVLVGAWSGIAMFLLRQLAGVQADFLGLARVLAVSLAPLVLALLLFWTDAILALSIISLGGVASLAVIGVLESVDVRPGPAWVATLAGFVVFAAVLCFLGGDTRDLAPGFFVASPP